MAAPAQNTVIRDVASFLRGAIPQEVRITLDQDDAQMFLFHKGGTTVVVAVMKMEDDPNDR